MKAQVIDVWEDEVLAVGTHYSDAITIAALNGHCVLEVVSSAGSTDLTYEVSLDGTNWSAPVDVDDNLLDAVTTALGAERKVVQFDPVPAVKMRLKAVVSVAEATVSAKYVQVVDRWS